MPASSSLRSRIADRLLLFPTTHSIDCGGAVRQNLKTEAGELELFVSRSPGCCTQAPVAIHLELSGNGSRAERCAPGVAQQWGSRPVEVWGFNYPGYGRSGGRASLAGLMKAGLGVFDAVRTQAGDRPVMLGCHSIGCAVGLHIAAQRAVDGLILLNPPPLRQLILRHYGWWNLWIGASIVAGQIPAEMDSLVNASRCTAPAVIFSAQRDRTVPPRFHRQIFETYAGPKRLVELKGFGHSEAPAFEEPPALPAVQWLWEQAVATKSR